MATQAQITINAVAGSNDDLQLGTLVTLSNNGLGDETTYLWSILSQPEGPADVLSSTTILSPTFTPTKEGSYLIRLIVNLGQPNEQTDQVIAAVRELETRERIPAAGETTENNASTGWANTAVDNVLQRVTRLEDSGYFIGVTGAAGMVAGNVVWIDDTTTIATGLPGQRTVPVVDLAPANVLTAIQNDVAILVSGVDGSPTPASGDLVRVLSSGLFLGVPYVGPAPSVGDPVYVSDSATLSLTAGTYPRVVGNVARASGGTFDVWFDSSADVTSILGPAGGVLGYTGSTYPDPNGLAGGDGTWAPAGRIPIAEPSGTEIQFRVDPRPTAGSGTAGAHLYHRAGLGAAASSTVPGAIGGDAALFGANGSGASATQSGGDGGSAGILGGECKDGGIGGGAFALAGKGGDGEPGGAFGPGAGGDVGISGGKGGASEQRARYLGIRHVLTGVKDKPAALTELQRILAVSPGECAFVGDDLNDLAVRPVVGLLICPADAVLPLRDRADWVLDRKGGDGAVRRLAEAILQARGDWDRLARAGWRGRND
jgi:YrbI family 3-deoxy-D-manno-octulosonate 8-phosphate phosphatase